MKSFVSNDLRMVLYAGEKFTIIANTDFVMKFGILRVAVHQKY